MIANLFGDFVKGSDYTHLPVSIQKGVRLHREIDDYIDNHTAITDLRLKLYSELPKIAGIAIDLYMDHLLAKNWDFFSKKTLEDFINNFFDHALNPSNQIIQMDNASSFKYPNEFIDLLTVIFEKKWITRYQHIEGLTMASTGLSKRISFHNELNKAPEVFLQMESEITSVFHAFMADARERFKYAK